MDLLIFPYNNMFSQPMTSESNRVIYVLKQNGQKIHFTDEGYWKKDMLEQSITHFAAYVQDNNNQYVDHFFLERLGQNRMYERIYPHLRSPEVDLKTWAIWYLSQAGQDYQINDKIEIVGYRWKKEIKDILFIDSITVKSVRL